MNVEITNLAEEDLDAIYRRIRDDSPTNAVRWREGLIDALHTLENFPRRCAIALESGPELEVRQLLYGRYRVLFTIDGGTVYVLHIRHGARQPLAPESSRRTSEDLE